MLVLTIAAGAALCQNAAPPASPGAQQAAPEQPAAAPSEAAPPTNPPAHQENPGLINEIGKMFNKLPAWKSPGETIDDLNARAKDAAKDATDTLSRLATPSMVTGRLACPASANGAPDCQAAAISACRGKGFNTGQPVDIRTAEKCTTSLWVSGQNPASTDCPAETVVLRASCQ